MNNITIDKLMPTQRQTTEYLSRGKLSVDSISKDKNINSDPDLNFNSTILLKNIQQRRLKVRAKLVEMFNLCCEKILDVENAGLTDLIFKLPESTFIDFNGCKDIDIINYIAKKLKQNKLDVLIMKNDTLFVTWKFIELNFESNFSSKNPR
jgi:hypothetical protein